MTDRDDILDELRGWIGREERSKELLAPAVAERFHRTLDLPGQPPGEGESAPRLIHFAMCQPSVATAALDRDGHIARGGFLPPVPLPRRMWAAGEIEFHGDLLVGQSVERISRIADVTFKTGKTGGLCFVAVDHRIEADGSVRIEERQTIVYREIRPASSDGARGTNPSPTPSKIQPVSASPALLFRYSGLTFNTHRIHYDRTYAMQDEGYPGLVVHGPLQATWLLHYAISLAAGASPRRFSFRGISPIFDHDQIHLAAGRCEEGRQNLWTARSDGTVAMQAQAIW